MASTIIYISNDLDVDVEALAASWGLAIEITDTAEYEDATEVTLEGSSADLQFFHVMWDGLELDV